MQQYQCKYFRIEELVSQQVFEIYRNRQHILWQQFDPRALYSLDMIREFVVSNGFSKSVLINTWIWGGHRQFSGLRLPGDDHYSQTSQHSHGRGFDATYAGIDTDYLRDYIIKNPQKHEFRYITCIELDTPTWLHIDTRNWDKEINGVLQVPWK